MSQSMAHLELVVDLIGGMSHRPRSAFLHISSFGSKGVDVVKELGDVRWTRESRR
jgi:hypothetical protein